MEGDNCKYDDEAMLSSDDDQMNENDFEGDEEEEVQLVDESIAKLVGHSQDVLCLSVSKSMQWLASGSQDDTACVWDLNSGASDPYLKITDHSDTVDALAFNSASTLLATADMSGFIICTELTTKKQLCKINDCSDIEWISWHNVADVLFGGTRDGLVWMWLITNDRFPQRKVYSRGCDSACTKGQLLPDGKRMLAVYADGEVRLWDLKNSSTVFSTQLSSSCLSIAVHPTRPLALIGCANGTASLLNTETNKIINTFGEASGGSEDDNSNSVEVVNFAPGQFPWILMATSCGNLVIYDVDNGVPRHECDHEGEAVVGAVFCASQGADFDAELQLLSACMDGGVRMWDAKSGEPIKARSCGCYGIFDFCIAEQNGVAKIFVACSEGVIRVFDY